MSRAYLYVSFLFFFSYKFVFADRIDQYYQMRSCMEQYLTILKEKVGDKASSTLHLDCYDNAEVGIQSASELVTGCISSGSILAHNPNLDIKINAIMQILIVVFGFVRNFSEMIQYKKEQKNWLASLDYTDVVLEFPHLILIEMQIKIMKLLVEMNIDGNPAEVAFARIHLASIILPGSCEVFSKKVSKKVYKKYFNKSGALISIEHLYQDKITNNFFKKIPASWKDLVMKVHTFPTHFFLFYNSIYKEQIFLNSYNQKILELIKAGRSQNVELMNALLTMNFDHIFSSIYNFYINPN